MQPDKKEKGMTLIVKTVTRLTIGFIFLYGLYIGLSGHISPGGGFAGGVIIALSFVHIMLAFGKNTALRRLHPHKLRFFMALGGLVFLSIVMMGSSGKLAESGKFINWARACRVFNNDITIPICEMVIVSTGLFAIFTALVLMTNKDKRSE